MVAGLIAAVKLARVESIELQNRSPRGASTNTEAVKTNSEQWLVCRLVRTLAFCAILLVDQNSVVATIKALAYARGFSYRHYDSIFIPAMDGRPTLMFRTVLTTCLNSFQALR